MFYISTRCNLSPVSNNSMRALIHVDTFMPDIVAQRLLIGVFNESTNFLLLLLNLWQVVNAIFLFTFLRYIRLFHRFITCLLKLVWTFSERKILIKGHNYSESSSVSCNYRANEESNETTVDDYKSKFANLRESYKQFFLITKLRRRSFSLSKNVNSLLR